MKNIMEMSREELLALRQTLQTEYRRYQDRNLKLDLSRGKPASSQLDLNNALLGAMPTAKASDGTDTRNYGLLEGLPEARALFSELLNIPVERIVIGGNSSLNLMYDAIVRCMLFGTGGQTPWCKLDKVKFLCPSPGYDRHFAICEDMGIEMITIPMTATGPDMDMVEELVANDPAIKGMWCVPLYSNPQGICYSDETVDRLGAMKSAAPDFRIFWDNAYGVHHLYEERSLKDIFAACEAGGNPDRPFYFFSTSKITFPGAGVALIASSPANILEIRKRMTIQTIGHDKVNQLRTVQYLRNADGVRALMRSLAAEMRPKFDMVLNILERELGNTGLATWIKPDGGYFVSLDTMPHCARETVRLAQDAGVKFTGAGATFPYKKDPEDKNLRIAPTYPTIEELQPAMEIFCLAVKLAGVEKRLAEI